MTGQHRLLTALLARFDATVLQAPPATAPWPPTEAGCFDALRAWCLAGAAPRTTQRLSVATLAGPPDRVHELATQLCLERDGSLQMQNLNAAGRITLRLKTKAHDLLPGRARQANDAWDAGTLIGSAQGQRALQQFRPRRPTLALADSLAPAALQAVLATLAAQQAAYAWPLRVLVLRKANTFEHAPWPERLTVDIGG